MFSGRFVVRVTRAGEESTAGADEVIAWFFSRQSPVATRSARTLAAAACVPFPLLPPPPHALPLRCRASGSLASERASERASEQARKRRSEPGYATTCHVPRAFQRAREFTQVVLRQEVNSEQNSALVSRFAASPFILLHIPTSEGGTTSRISRRGEFSNENPARRSCERRDLDLA